MIETRDVMSKAPSSSRENGRRDLSLTPRPMNGAAEPPGLGDVTRDAINQVREIVSDSVALGKLEVKQTVAKVEDRMKDVVPRMIAGALGSAMAFVGIVIGLIAIYFALEGPIPSVAARLGIFTAFFLLLAAGGGFFAMRPNRERHIVVPATSANPMPKRISVPLPATSERAVPPPPIHVTPAPPVHHNGR